MKNYLLTTKPKAPGSQPKEALYVACETYLYDEPVKVTTFWKVIGISNPYGSPLPLTLPLTPPGTNGTHRATSDLNMLNPGAFLGIRSITYFIDPKATQDVLQIREDVPCPRRRYKEKRWFDGRWQGLSTKGWVDL